MKLRTITVRELVESLEDFQPDTLVVFASDYGDHCHTMQAVTIKGEFEVKDLQRSGYSDSGFAVPSEDDDGRPREDSVKALVIT